MIRHKDSHLDHGLTPAQVEYLLERFAGRDAFFIETIELPPELGTVPCGLYGPTMGDEPVPDADWRSCGYCGACQFYLSGALCSAKTNANGGAYAYWRGDRKYHSRVVDRPTRPTNKVTVIAGPHDGAPCVLFTAFGGPAAPQEPGDPSCKDVEASRAFWAEHALAYAHTRDADCAPFLRADGTCTVCGVAHGEPCGACGGRGFHVAGCTA